MTQSAKRNPAQDRASTGLCAFRVRLLMSFQHQAYLAVLR